jgi:ABC-2 type transport system permease protein
MLTFLTLTRRELAAYFVSITGYVIIATFTFLMSFSFVVLIADQGNKPTHAPMTEMFYMTLFFWIVLILATSVITMKLFAQEKAQGTFETLMTTPVSDFQVVMAKFSAAMLFYLVMWLPQLACLWIVRHFGGEQTGLDTGALGTTYLGILLLGGVFISLGCFASSITRVQVVAAIISLAAGFSLILLSFLPDRLPGLTAWQSQLLANFQLPDQMHDFTRGVLDTRPIVFYLSLTFLFLFLTLRAVESRRWK